MNKLLTSRVFWTAILGAIVDIALLTVGQFVPAYLDFVNKLLGYLTPVFVAIIAAFTVQDSLMLYVNYKLGKLK